MPSEILTMREAEREIQALIDRFADTIFVPACEEMESAAQIAREARQEEQCNAIEAGDDD